MSFRVRATQALGSGNLTFTASYGGKSASQGTDVSIRPAAAYRAQIDIARVAPNSKKAVLTLRNMYDQESQRQASISTVPLVLSQGLSNWLEKYSNYCSEQLVSMAVPRLVMAKWSAAPVIARATPQPATRRPRPAAGPDRRAALPPECARRFRPLDPDAGHPSPSSPPMSCISCWRRATAAWRCRPT